MGGAEFAQFIQEKGRLTLPIWLLDNLQALDIGPEELGYLVLAWRQGQQDKQPAGEEGTGADAWLGRALDKGWACWQGEGQERRIVFDPLWQQLYALWEKAQAANETGRTIDQPGTGDFDYCRIVKELDRLRGSLSVTSREKQLIQELNLKYGWSTEFMLNFFRMCCHRGLSQSKNYKPLAAQIYRAGIYTIEGLTEFMDQVDWISRQAAEIKRDYLGLYGMVTVMERDYYVKWHINWQMSHGVIVRAARETVGAANATFKYLDKVLEDWYQQGIQTLEACEEALGRRADEKAKKQQEREKGKDSGRKRQVERDTGLWAGFEDN